MDRTHRLFSAAFILCLVALCGAGFLHAGENPPETGLKISIQPWKEARELFRGDPCWLGGDGASSVELGDGRVLWLFGDSFIDPSGSGSRHNATIVRNSVAIQTGYRPETARMSFSWKVLGNRPRAMFREEGEDWFWPGSGIRLGDALLVFLVRTGWSDNALGFEATGWKAVLVPNPDSTPTLWGMIPLEKPATRGVLVGSASALALDGFLYAFGSDTKGEAVHAVRWPLAEAAAGSLAAPQWWMGPDRQWVRNLALNEKPVPVFQGGQVEFTVHYESDLKVFLQVQTLSLLEPCLAVRVSPAVSRSWSQPACFYRPPEGASSGLLIYAGKAHKVFEGTDLAFTYAVNTTSAEQLMNDMELYYPVVLKGEILVKRHDGRPEPCSGSEAIPAP
ncbi:MAG TPA: hypothetical protein PLP82_06480 [Deltaproteobacteria bacterium]|jgi:hypothetical protein|nr:DUF4185 domain-containing protein [Deltaproteobacteria bacterium]OQC25620.1 MAG: hypothetical protein BWX71_01654 [Deltaproteobacteria bacterium ADurb.Bin072]HRW80367.1 hypothetical protein [Desulfomonilia bacterium]HNQ85373.1 hypothetical protein [Deltaproteobacteria bacterium]HNS89385.1 hypothetical protein [Deltaproteobacteria bacterium]